MIRTDNRPTGAGARQYWQCCPASIGANGVLSLRVSTKAEQIAAVVGRRTVYSMAEIHEMARTREVLVVQFRQDRILSSEPVGIEELVMAGVIQRSPQSITKTRPEGAAWLARRIQV